VVSFFVEVGGEGGGVHIAAFEQWNAAAATLFDNDET